GADGPSLRYGGAGDRLGPCSGQPPPVEANLPDRQSRTAPRMTSARCGGPVTLLWCFVAVTVCVAASASAQGPDDTAPVVSAPGGISDFLIQNICLDASRTVLAAVSPIGRDAGCAAARDRVADLNVP